jgi:phosphate transport system permease protein
MIAMVAAARPELFTQRRRPVWELMLDRGFQRLVVVLASVVGVVLLGILLTVVGGAQEAVARFGLNFLTSSDWDPIGEHYGAFTAIYGTVVSSLLALLIAVPRRFS